MTAAVNQNDIPPTSEVTIAYADLISLLQVALSKVNMPSAANDVPTLHWPAKVLDMDPSCPRRPVVAATAPTGFYRLSSTVTGLNEPMWANLAVGDCQFLINLDSLQAYARLRRQNGVPVDKPFVQFTNPKHYVRLNQREFTAEIRKLRE